MQKVSLMVQKARRVNQKDILRLLSKINRLDRPEFSIEIDWKEKPFHVLVHKEGQSTLHKFRFYYQIADLIINLPQWKEYNKLN